MNILAIGILTITSMLCALAGLTIFPLKFKYSILPGIEKKRGVKIKYAPLWDAFAFGSYLSYGESAGYIVAMHIAYLRGKKPKPVSERKSPGGLSKIGYAVGEFSKREIVWSYCAMINFIICFVCAFLLFFFNP